MLCNYGWRDGVLEAGLRGEVVDVYRSLKMAAAATSASTSTAVTAPTNPDTQITNLKKDIQKLSDELRSKNDLLNSLLDLAHKQSMHIASLKAAVEDTVHWDPDISPQPSSSSRPKPLWSEVVCRRKRPLDRDGLLLSNRYDVLSAPTSDDVLLEAAPPLSGENHRPVAASRPEKESRPPSASGGSSSAKRRQLLRDAVSRRPDSRRRPNVTHVLVGSANNAGSPSAVATGASGSKSAASPPAAGVAVTAATSPPPGASPPSSAASPARATGVTPTPACSPAATGPLTSAARSRGRGDPPGSFVVGTSMVRYVRVNGSRTFCHPGALIRDITNSAHQLSLRNPSTHTIIVHAGVNDLKFQQSETLKKDFITLIHSIKQLDKQCIISGPLPSPRFGDIKFSRLQRHLATTSHLA
uniref:SGNH hydrolase-type esterase domain-containing protein n=1 Tax=Oryzias sinensis TaxID=183150 RepID=A0A8C7Y637_9TELE